LFVLGVIISWVRALLSIPQDLVLVVPTTEWDRNNDGPLLLPSPSLALCDELFRPSLYSRSDVWFIHELKIDQL
jgi:hypothetical protein